MNPDKRDTQASRRPGCSARRSGCSANAKRS